MTINRFIYVPVASVDVADRLARGVLALARPPSIREPGDITTHAFGWVVHPDSGVVLLEIDTAAMAYCHALADPTDLLAAVAAATTAAERDALLALVNGLKEAGGGSVPLLGLVPHAAMLESLSHEQAEAAGFFSPPQLP